MTHAPGSDLLEKATSLAMGGDTPAALNALANVMKNRIKINTVRIKEAQDQRNLGNNQRAEEILRLAIEDAGGGSLLGELYHNLGTNSQGAKQFGKALKYLHIAFALRRDSGDLLGAAYTAFQIPMCKKMSGEPDDNLRAEFRKARTAIAEVVSMNKNLAPEHLSNMKQNFAFCLQAEKDYVAALAEYTQLLPLREAAESNKDAAERRLVAMTRARIAECHFALGQNDLALEEARKALEVFEHIEDKNRIKQVRDLIEKIEETKKTNSAP